jgi:hypothetical protein
MKRRANFRFPIKDIEEPRTSDLSVKCVSSHPSDRVRENQAQITIRTAPERFLFTAPDWKQTLLLSGIRVIQSAVMDLDGDGNIDMIGAQYHPGLIFWLEHPNHPLQEPWKYHVIDDFKQGGADGVHGLALADMDGDGHPDLVAASGWTGGNFPDSIVWYRIPKNPREAAPWERFVIANRNAPGFNHYPAVGDVNGDGRADVASAAKVGVDGNWFAWWEHLADGDIDVDGDIDFATCAKDAGILSWFENDGKGHFTQHRIHEDQSTYEVRLVDMNGDGIVDILVAGQESQNVACYENHLRKRSRH